MEKKIKVVGVEDIFLGEATIETRKQKFNIIRQQFWWQEHGTHSS